MSKKNRKRKTGENEMHDKLIDPVFDKLPDHVSCMWELPQIYEFLCFAKDTLHIENLSMYEMERMLSMPKASSQLANIMTSLLSSSMPRSRLLKIPPMPYEFWTDILLNHKLSNWLKVYESKEHDSIKVLDVIGIEPEFWTIFSDVSTISQRNFEELNLRQRIWLLKTVCDTLMHGKKSLQDEVASRYLEGEGERILGRDRHGARYFYFPIFLDNDIRVYKHNINNKILLNVTPIVPKLKLHTRRIYNRRDRRRKKSRWKNGNLPQKQKKRIKVVTIKKDELKDDVKAESNDERICHTDYSNVEYNMIPDSHQIFTIETEEKEEKAIPNLSSMSKSTGIRHNDDPLYVDNVSNSSKTDDEKINEVKTITCNNSSIECSSLTNNGAISKIYDEKWTETKTMFKNNDGNDKSINNNDCLSDQGGLNIWMKALSTNNESKENIREYPDETSHDSFNENSDGIRKRRKILCKRETTDFNNILMDLSISTFQLVADSVESLRQLVTTLSLQNSIATNVNEPVRCEMLLMKKLKTLIASLKSKESILKKSTQKAKEKLVREWKNFQQGVDHNNDDTNGARYISQWVLGSQGCPLLSCSDTMQHDEDENDCEKSEIGKNDDENEEDEIKKKTETRRILRARGVSSYIEQFTSDDDDTDSSQPEGWVETVDPVTGIHLGVTLTEADGARENDEESGSDQDWILPGERKRKSKRVSSTKRFKSFQNKIQSIELDLKNAKSSLSVDANIKQKKLLPNNPLSSIKIESVHSEFHIKDEAPTQDPLTLNTNAIINNNSVQPNYLVHQVVNTPNGPMNYVVMPNDNLPLAQSSSMVSMVPQVSVQPGYYMQNSQGYVVSNSQLTPIRSSFINQSNVPPIQGVIIQQNPYITPSNNYIQYHQRGMSPSVSLYPLSVQTPIVNQSVRLPIQSTKPQPRIVHERQLVPPHSSRHPVGAVIRSTMPFKAGIRPVTGGRGCGGKLVASRNLGGACNIRPTKINPIKCSIQNDITKTASLIVLSDSDDEIEMIIPQKNSETQQIPAKNNNSSLQCKIVENKTPIASSTRENQQSSSQAVLTPQIIQRMSQGGISITPIKPKSPVKSSPISSTQLVVVVNETGSHYALALPNGSKLILTPEQVAQIRASNGGKLVL